MGDNSGIISLPAAVPSERTALPEGFCWREIEDCPTIVDFLQQFYVEDEEELFRLKYSEEFFRYLFADPRHRPEFSLGLYRDGVLAGYTLARMHSVFIAGQFNEIVSINFLCLDRKYRKMGLGPVIIKEITRVVNGFGIFQALFTGKTDYGFSFTSSAYSHLPLDPVKLIKVNFLDFPVSIENDYVLREGTCRAMPEHYSQIWRLYCDSLPEFAAYEKFSIEQFCYVMMDRGNVVRTVFNKEKSEFASCFFIDTICPKSKDVFTAGYLYYWAGTPDIVRDLVAMIRSEGVSLFNVLDFGNNASVIEDLGRLEGTTSLKYHLYNWRVARMSSSDLNIVLY